MSIDQITLQDIYDFMETGSLDNAPAGVADYLTLLDKTRGMMLRIDRFANDEMIIKHLILVDNLSRYKAKNIIDEAREYFYSSSKVSKMAWRNIYAEKLDKVTHFAMVNMKGPSDASKVSKMLLDLATLRGVFEADIETIPEEVFQRPIRLYSMDASVFEFGKVDRQKLAAMIDKFPDLNEREKNRIKQESLCMPLKIFPDEQTDARKL